VGVSVFKDKLKYNLSMPKEENQHLLNSIYSKGSLPVQEMLFSGILLIRFIIYLERNNLQLNIFFLFMHFKRRKICKIQNL